MTKLTCLSQSICSWNYLVTISDYDFKALVVFDFMRERGYLDLESGYYDIKHTWLSNKWSLESDGTVIATALNPNSFTRSFEVFYDSCRLVLRAEFPFSRSFVIEREE